MVGSGSTGLGGALAMCAACAPAQLAIMDSCTGNKKHLLIVRRALREQIVLLHRRLLAIVREDEVCRRLMTIPGVGPVVALTYRVTVDVPARFRKSKAVGAAFGLTPSRYQSGESEQTGGISRCGDDMMRATRPPRACYSIRQNGPG